VEALSSDIGSCVCPRAANDTSAIICFVRVGESRRVLGPRRVIDMVKPQGSLDRQSRAVAANEIGVAGSQIAGFDKVRARTQGCRNQELNSLATLLNSIRRRHLRVQWLSFLLLR
jgi:hypothetical protein